MRVVRNVIPSLLLALAPLVAGAQESVTYSLFDGETLSGWTGDDQVWRVEEGAITAEIPEGRTLDRNEFLFWGGTVADFELSLEFRISGGPDANSGIQYRSERLENGDARGYQADLDGGQVWLGRIYDEHGRGLIAERGAQASIAPDGRRWVDQVHPPESFANLLRADGWNEYRILASGPHVELWINGRRVTALDDHQTGESELVGMIALQLHSGAGPAKLQFRNILLRADGETSSPQSPAAVAAAGNRQTESPVLWHLRDNPASASPVDCPEAQQVVAGMKLVEGFQAELIAAEPVIHQPIAFTIDERGRLWVVEAFSYPNRQPEGEGKDRIRILADQDGDGEFETATTFAEGLNLVSGIEVGFGGVWVGAAPELLFIPDRDGDDVPDGPPVVLLDGFGYQDTHETLNSFTWGPDGWLYGNQGVFNTASIGKPGAPPEERTTLRAGVWRYHPVRHEFEVFAHGGSNQWGLAFNAAGDLFMTHCRSYWGGGGTTCVLRNGHFWNQTNSDYPDFISNAAPQGIPHLQNFLPASAKYDSGEGGAGKPGTTAVYGGHSHVGTMIYGGDNWPAKYRDHLFTHNLHGHQINHQVNVRQGSAYETFHGGYDIAWIPDPAYVAVDLKYGPDGAVYVSDWVDQQHCHNPRPENWDGTNGRIYRISWAETFDPVQTDLSKFDDAGLASHLSHANRWYADTARRILQHRAAERPIDAAALERLRASAAAGGPPRIVLESLWTLHVTDGLDDATLAAALSSPDDVVRAWAIRLATEFPTAPRMTGADLERLAKADPSPTVRLAIASALPTLPAAERWPVVEALAAHGEDSADRFLPKLTWQGLGPIVSTDIGRALALAESTPLPTVADSIVWHAAKSSEGRDRIVERLARLDGPEFARQVRLLHFSLQREASLPRPAGWTAVLSIDLPTGDRRRQQLPGLLDELSAVFGDEDVLTAMRARLTDESAAPQARQHSLAILNRVGDRKLPPLFPRLLEDESLRPQVIPLASRSNDPEIARQLLRLLDQLSPDERSSALGVLSSRVEFADVLLGAIEEESLDKRELSSLQVRQMHNLGDAALTERLERQYGRIGVSSEEARQLIDKLRVTYTTAPLWAYSENRGEQVFKKTCAVCHPLDGTSVPLGPGLKGSWRNGLDYFLENIVDPNAVVGENYRMTVVVTDSGEVHSGLLDSETDSTLVLRTAERTISVPKGEIEERRLVEQSMMPTGLLDNLSEIEVIELLKFLLKRE
ncbi:MAG: DUF1080 domain-containing protein [Planctomyces sp.]|nr:DUF1080 domain-containing protein [Planctomyces sp.]